MAANTKAMSQMNLRSRFLTVVWKRGPAVVMFMVCGKDSSPWAWRTAHIICPVSLIRC